MKRHTVIGRRLRSSFGRLQIAGLLLLLLPILWGACSRRVTLPPAAGSGVAVAPEFAAFYRDHGGLRIFGEALEPAFIDSENGRIVQYFDRMRLEYDDARPPGNQIIIAPLGEWAVELLRSPSTLPVAESARQRHFPETNLAIQNGFLAFYEANQGERLFGPPITPPLDDGGRRVQYFRNAGLEWWPEAPLEHRVQVSRLGYAHYHGTGVAYERNRRILAAPLFGQESGPVQLAAAVRAPILYQEDEQIIYVAVSQQGGAPAAGVPVQLLVSYNGRQEQFSLGETNSQGKAQGVLLLENAVPGQQIQVTVYALAADGAIRGTTWLTFKTWW